MIRSTAYLAIVAGVGYYLLAEISLAFLILPEGIAPFWLGSGFSLALLLLTEKRHWAGILAGIFIACMVGNVKSGYALPTSLGLSAANLVEPFIAAFLIRRFFPKSIRFADVKEIVGFILSSLGACMIGAAIGAGTVIVTHSSAGFFPVWSLWFADDVLGVLIVAPLMLTWFSFRKKSEKGQGDDFLSDWSFPLFLILFLTVCVLVFGRPSQGLLSLHNSPYWPLPFLVYCALRHKGRGTSIACLMLAVISVGFTVKGVGPYAVEGATVGERVLALQFYLGINLASILLLVGAINQRDNNQKLLAESEHRLSELIEQSPIGLALCHIDGSLVAVNSAYAEIVGYGRDEVLTLSYWDITPEKYASDDEKLLEQLKTTGRYGPYEKEYRHKNGHLVPVRLHGMIVVRDGEELIWSSVEDISALKKAEAEKAELADQLRFSQKMEAIGTLAGGVAHDFNNILSAILGYSELSLRNPKCDEKIRKNLDHVIAAAVRARDLVRQILMFSRKEEAKLEPVRIHEVVLEVVKMLRTTIPTSITIKQDIDAATGTVLADATQIHQVVMNLCTNAYQSMPDHVGEISVSLKAIDIDEETGARYPDLTAQRCCQLVVADNGEGIPGEVLERIFEPFFTTKKHGEGTGMGLAVVHGIVRRLGGGVGVESVVGQGSTFEILLPLVSGAAEVSAEPDVVPVNQRGDGNILLIDDEEMLVDLGRETLEPLGYRVTTMTSPVTALDAFRSDPQAYDLIITDQTMPGMTGDILAKQVLSLRPDMPIIIYTGHSAVLDEEKAQAIGVKKLLMKPVERALLIKAVRAALDSESTL